MGPDPKIDSIFYVIAYNMMQHIETENIDLRTIIQESLVLCLSRSTQALSANMTAGYNEMLTTTVNLELVLPYSAFGNQIIDETLTEKVPDKIEENTEKDNTEEIVLTRFSGLEFDD